MSDIVVMWEKSILMFPILCVNANSTFVLTDVANEDIGTLVKDLDRLDLAESVYESILIEIERYVRDTAVPQFWNYFQTSETSEGFYQFQYAVFNLEQHYSLLQEILRRTYVFAQFICHLKDSTIKNPYDQFDEIFKSILLSQLSPTFNDVVYDFYSVSFKIFVNSHCDQISEDDELDDIPEIRCNGCDLDAEYCRCQELIFAFNKVNENLNKMELLDRLAGFTLTTLIQEKMTIHVRDTCQGIFDKSHLENLQKWLDLIVLNWLTRIFNNGHLDIDDEETRNVVENFKIKLTYYLHEIYAKQIIEQFFNIIIDFPDSTCAIDDLKLCLEKIEIRKHLIESLKNSLEVRILHPGVNTMDILTGYVAAIKTIRHFDSSGVILETVTEPIKEYLRKRSDTVRRVVTGLTEEGPTDLAEELAKSEALKENIDLAKKKEEVANWENWQPDPADAIRTTSAVKSNRSADIISMVVDIYGSKELFVNEYRNLLADRLLTQLDFKPEKEIRNLELLKLRFGETLLHGCEVMLKDISDSKRINTHIQSDTSYCDVKTFDMSSLIISSQFWPPFNKETLELPEEMEAEFKKYTKSYESYKGNRTLSWRHVTGRVVIEIEFEDRTLEMSVTPTQAVIIYHFQTKNEWTLDDLSSEIKVPQSVLRKRIVFWQTQGLIKESNTDVYTLIESAKKDINDVQVQEILEEEEGESAMASASDQREEELQVFWSYIVGMLTNLDSLPIERIHQMLKMFASHGPGVEFSQDELKNFLQRKVREHKLVYTGGAYQLSKS